MNTLHDSDEDDENDIINLVELQHKIQLYMYYIQMCCKFIYIIEIWILVLWSTKLVLWVVIGFCIKR